MTNPIDTMLFKNASFMKAFDAAMNQDQPPRVICEGRNWRVDGVTELFERDDNSLISCISSIFQRILHWIKNCFSKSYAARFEHVAKEFNHALAESVADTSYTTLKTEALAQSLTPQKPELDSPGTSPKESKNSIKATAQLFVPPPKYAENLAFISKYKNKADLSINGSSLETPKKAPSYDKDQQQKIANKLKETCTALEQETADYGHKAYLEFFKKKASFNHGLYNISLNRTGWMGSSDTIISQTARELHQSCNESLDFDLIANYQIGCGYEYEENNDIYHFTPASSQKIALPAHAQTKLGETCEQQLKSIGADEIKRGRLIRGLYNLLAYASKNGYEKLITKLQELLAEIEHTKTASFTMKSFIVSAQRIYNYSETEQYLYVDSGELVLKDEESSSKDQQLVGKWVQGKVIELWKKYDETPELRKSLLELARKFEKGLIHLTNDYKDYADFHKSLRSIYEQLGKEIKNKTKSLASELEKASTDDIQSIYQAGSTEFMLETIRKTFANILGKSLTDQAIRFSFGKTDPGKTLSSNELVLLLTNLSTQMHSYWSKNLIQQTCMEAEGFALGEV